MRILLVAALSLVPIAAFAGDALPISATIAQVLKSPNMYDKKIVRLEGQIDNCFGFTCNLCPEEMTGASFDIKKCLGVSFYGFSGVDRLMERAFRFAVVKLDARFDPSCLEDKVICLDRVSELFDARVVEVRSRHSASDGIVSWHDEGNLVPATPIDEQGMKTELDAMGSPPDPALKSGMHYFILDDQTGRRKTGLACICREQTCEGRWPTRLFWGFNSIGNPFSCSLMEKFDAGWRITADENF
jgi:hypothetical protein